MRRFDRVALSPCFPGLPILLAMLMMSAGFAVRAQDATGEPPSSSTSGSGRRGISIAPRVNITEIITDNVNLSAGAKQADQITELSPGIRITSDFGRIKGYFDYALSARLSAQGNSTGSMQNALTSFGTFEAVENFAFLDFSGAIAQQAVSGLGAQSSGGYASNANQTETSSFRLSPYLRGTLAGMADYETRYSYNSTRSQSGGASDVATKDFSALLKGRNSASLLGWSLQATQQSTSYSLGRATETEALTGALSYAVGPNVVLTASAGQEANNFNGLSKESSWTNGQGLRWTPSPNASFSASRQTRPFGQSHNLNFAYRTARTAWSFTDSQDVTNTPSQSALGSLGSIYDLFFAQFASVEPDPVKRAVLVNNFLQANGINPNAIVVSSFLTSSVALQRRQDLSFSLLGVRDTLTVTATRSETSRLDSVTTAIDDLSNATSVRQSGLSISYSHRLTPDTSMSLTGLAQQSSDSKGLQETSSNSLSLGLTTRLGLRSTAMVSARRVVFDSRTTPYNETAITGTISVQF